MVLRVEQKYGPIRVVTGHSLGGKLHEALYVERGGLELEPGVAIKRRSDVLAVAFNPFMASNTDDVLSWRTANDGLAAVSRDKAHVLPHCDEHIGLNSIPGAKVHTARDVRVPFRSFGRANKCICVCDCGGDSRW